MKAIDIAIGDTHIGHRSAIMYPQEGISPVSRWLYRVWDTEFLPSIFDILKRHKKAHKHLLLGGDLADLDVKLRSPEEIWAHQIDELLDNIYNLLGPVVEKADSIHVLEGTRSHIGGLGGVDALVARDIGAVPGDAGYAHMRPRYELAGVLCEAQHYGKSMAKWGDENMLNSLRDEITKHRAQAKRRIPDVNYRFHFHWCGRTDLEKFPQVIQVPAWQINPKYMSHSDAVGRTAEVGGFVNVFEDGKIIEQHRLRYTYPESEIWKPS